MKLTDILKEVRDRPKRGSGKKLKLTKEFSGDRNNPSLWTGKYRGIYVDVEGVGHGGWKATVSIPKAPVQLQGGKITGGKPYLKDRIVFLIDKHLDSK